MNAAVTASTVSDAAPAHSATAVPASIFRARISVPPRRAFLAAGATLTAGVALGAFGLRPARAAVLPDVSRFTGAARARIEGDMLIVTTSCLPDHGSPYFRDTRYESYRYEDIQGRRPRFRQSPGVIEQRDMVFRIPLNPQTGGAPMSTPMGPMGVAFNGVPFFNQYAGGGAPLSHEAVSFDQYNGHPSPDGMYHYHVEPYALTKRFGRDALLGFLLDGHPVYGPLENGRLVTNTDLDECHGHAHATRDYPDGVYHYHTTDEAPYIAGVGFRGQFQRRFRGALNSAGVEIAYVEPVVCRTPAA